VAPEFFVDTSAWYPLILRTDPDHARISATFRALIGKRRRLVTTNLVVAETHALLLRRVGRAAALNFARTVVEPPTQVVRASEQHEHMAVREWLLRHEDQDFSLTDAVSFAVMSELGIEEALTLDRHFVAAGFRML
jgi:predicted nucleic acid-binding protein